MHSHRANSMGRVVHTGSGKHSLLGEIQIVQYGWNTEVLVEETEWGVSRGKLRDGHRACFK